MSANEVINLPANAEGIEELSVSVDDMTMRVKKITITDDGKLQVVMEAEGMDDHAIAQVKDMLLLQQSCLVKVNMLPLQRDMFER